MSTLAEFMTAHRVTNGTYTHVTFGHEGFPIPSSNGRGKYNIPLDERKQFSELVAKAAFGQAQTEFFIVERSEAYGPIRIDFDFKYTVDPTHLVDGQVPRFYKSSLMDELVAKLATTIHEVVQVPYEDLDKRMLFVFEKPAPSPAQTTDDGTVTLWKDGLHIMMPRVITSPAVQRLIRTEMLDLLGPMCEEHKSVGVTPTNSAEDMYDDSVLQRNGWPVWGSVKQGGKRYHLASIWNTSAKGVHRYRTVRCKRRSLLVCSYICL